MHVPKEWISPSEIRSVHIGNASLWQWDLPGTSHLTHHLSPLLSFIHSFGQLARLPEALLGDASPKVNLCRALSLSHGKAEK